MLSSASTPPPVFKPPFKTPRSKDVPVLAPRPLPPLPRRRRDPIEDQRLVTKNAAALERTIEDVVETLSEADYRSLDAMYAPGERPPSNVGATLAETYTQEILASEMARTVTVWAYGDITIYVAYSVAEWRDGGIDSEHTIPIPMRFIDGRWYLSRFTLDTPRLEYVSTVRLP
jgi:hypothetical protein